GSLIPIPDTSRGGLAIESIILQTLLLLLSSPVLDQGGSCMTINQTPTVTPDDDHVGPSLIIQWMLPGLLATLPTVTMLSVARLFGYDTNKPLWDPLNLRAGSIALGIDGFFFLFLYMARGFWTKRRKTFRSTGTGFSWFIAACGLGIFSWFANS